MSKPKRHHYLPQSYLVGFSADDGCVCVYDRVRNEYRPQKPLNTGVISHYYSVIDDKGEKRTDLESELLQFVDGNGISAIKKAQTSTDLDEEDRAKIAVFCAYLQFRIPNYEKSINHCNEQILKKIAEMTFSTPERTEAVLAELKEDSNNDSEIDPKEMTEFIQSGKYRIETDRSFSLRHMIDLSQKMAPILGMMDWCFLHPPSGKTFVTCDNPFVLIPPQGWKPGGWYGFGICTTGARKLIPLASDLCLVMYDKGEGMFWREASLEETRHINLTITDNCHEYVIARDEALLRSLVNKTGISEREWKPSINIG